MCCDAKTIFCTVIELFVLYFFGYILRKIGEKVNTSVNHTEGTYKLTQFNFIALKVSHSSMILSQ